MSRSITVVCARQRRLGHGGQLRVRSRAARRTAGRAAGRARRARSRRRPATRSRSRVSAAECAARTSSTPDRGHRLERAVDRARVGMAGKGRGVERLARARLRGSVSVAPDRGEQLPAHALDRRRGRSAARSARDAAARPSRRGSRPASSPRARPSSLLAAKPNCAARSSRAIGEGGRVELARAFLQQRRHQARRALATIGIERGAAEKARLDRQDRDGVVLVEPGLDPARRGDRRDLDLGLRGQAGARRRARALRRSERRPRGSLHAAPAARRPAPVSQPVTEFSIRNTASAAACTSSGVTACSRSGHAATSSRVSPEVSATPMRRARRDRSSSA